MEGPLGSYRKGDVVILPMRFTDDSDSKRRPGIIIATPKGNNSIVLLVTSKEPRSPYGVQITTTDFAQGGLLFTSHVKTNIISTIENNRIIKKAGTLTNEKIKEIENKLIKLLVKGQ